MAKSFGMQDSNDCLCKNLNTCSGTSLDDLGNSCKLVFFGVFFFKRKRIIECVWRYLFYPQSTAKSNHAGRSCIPSFKMSNEVVLNN